MSWRSSFPWEGLTDLGSKVATALGMGPGGGAAASWIYLMWTHDSLIPGQPTQGTVTGRVVRPTWPEGATVPV